MSADGAQQLTQSVLADEGRVSYKAIGATKGSVSQLVGPSVVAKGLLTTAKTGIVQGRTIGSASQLGGAVVIAPGNRVLFEQTATDAGDNVAPELPNLRNGFHEPREFLELRPLVVCGRDRYLDLDRLLNCRRHAASCARIICVLFRLPARL